MKLQWKSVSPEQERRNSLLHGYRSLIGGCCESEPPAPQEWGWCHLGGGGGEQGWQWPRAEQGEGGRRARLLKFKSQLPSTIAP